MHSHRDLNQNTSNKTQNAIATVLRKQAKNWNFKKVKRYKGEIFRSTNPRTVRQKILEGARKWMGPWEGFVFIRLRRNLMYFIFWRTSPPERQISSHLTMTTFCPLSSSLATIDAKRPSMWWRASTTTRFEHIPDPDTIFASPSVCVCVSGWRDTLTKLYSSILGFKGYLRLFNTNYDNGPSNSCTKAHWKSEVKYSHYTIMDDK